MEEGGEVPGGDAQRPPSAGCAPSPCLELETQPSHLPSQCHPPARAELPHMKFTGPCLSSRTQYSQCLESQKMMEEQGDNEEAGGKRERGTQRQELTLMDGGGQ